jgi:hypothetical protein
MLPGTALWYAVASRVDDPLAFTALSFALGVILAGTFRGGCAGFQRSWTPAALEGYARISAYS